MQTPDQILSSLDQIAAESSTKGKEQLLKAHMADENFAKIVEYMLDPYKMFGINDFDSDGAKTSGRAPTIEEVLIALNNLVSRSLTGNHARLVIGSFVKDGFPAELMTRILTKDPKAGFRDTLVNKVVKGFIPEFPYMRCSLPEKSNLKNFPWEIGVFSQLKADGMFVNVNLDQELQVELSSRNGTKFPAKGFEEMHVVVQRRLDRGTQTHGELLVQKPDGTFLSRQEGNGMINSVIQGGNWEEGHRPVFFAWDQVPLQCVLPKGRYSVGYQSRFKSLQWQVEHGDTNGMLLLIETRIVCSLSEAFQHFKEKLLEGLEGTIIKNPTATWMDGTSKDQVKMKLEFECDVRITGFTEGNGKFAKTFGAITYESECGKLKGKTSGISDADRAYINSNRDKYLNTIMAIEANAVFEPSPSNPLHTLSHPRVKEFRKDKSVADNLERIMEQMKAAMNAADSVK